MLKLRKPFSRKVQLHIRQDLLQKLWDKYVPEASAEYGRIELIYPDVRGWQAGGEPRQIQLLVNLVLQNRILKAGLSGSGAALAARPERMEQSAKRAERCFMTQLRCYDVRLYRTVNKYVTLLEKVRKEGRRYQSWQRENRIIERQRAQHRLFSEFFSDINRFFTDHAVETAREMEKELIRILSEDEYRLLTKRIPNLAEPKEFMLQYVEVMEAGEIRQLWTQLEESSRQSQNRLKETGQHLEVQTDGEPQRLKEQIKIEEMGRQDTGSEFQEKMKELHRRYTQEVVRAFRERVSSILNTELYQTITQPYSEIADMVLRSRVYQESAKMVPVSEEAQNPIDEIQKIMDSVQMKLEVQKEQLWQREAQAIHTYEELYREVLKEQNFTKGQEDIGRFQERTSEKVFLEEVLKLEERTSEEGHTEDVGQFVEGIFRNQYQRDMNEGELRDICEWSRVFAELFVNPISAEKKFVSIYSVVSRYMKEHWQSPVLDEKKRVEFLRSLCDMIRIWIQVSSYGQSEEQGNQKTEIEKKSVWQTVEETYRSQHPEEMDEADFRELCRWSRAFTQTATEVSPEERKAEHGQNMSDDNVDDEAGYHEEMAYLVEEIHRNLEGKEPEIFSQEHVRKLSDSIRLWNQLSSKSAKEGPLSEENDFRQLIRHLNLKMEERQAAGTTADKEEIDKASQEISEIEVDLEQENSFQLVYTDRQFQSQPVQSLLHYIRELNEEQYESLLSELSQITQIQWRLSQGQEMEKAEQELRQILVQRNRGLVQPEPYLRMWEWGEALLFCPEYAQNGNADSQEVWGQEKNPAYDSESSSDSGGHAPAALSSEDKNQKQTQWIRRQIEEAKDRNNLQQLIGQINHRLVITQKAEQEETKAEEAIQLIYADSQLTVLSVQNLLHYLRNLDEEEYGVLVKELAQVTKVQSMLNSGAGLEEETAREVRQMFMLRKQSRVSYDQVWEWGKALLYYPEHGEGKRKYGTLPTLPAEEGRRRTHLIYADDRNNLQQLIWQLNHMTAAQPAEMQKSPSIQNLLDSIQDLNEEQYEILSEELAEVTRIQQRFSLEREQSETRPETADITHRTKQILDRKSLSDVQNLQNAKSKQDTKSQWDVQILRDIENQQEIMDRQEVQRLEAAKNFQEVKKREAAKDFQEVKKREAAKDFQEVKSRQAMKNFQDVQSAENLRNLQELDFVQSGMDLRYQSHREAYLELAHRIRQYEVQRRQTVRKNLRQILRQFQESYFYSSQSGRIRKDITDTADMPDMINIADITDLADLADLSDVGERFYQGGTIIPGAGYPARSSLSREELAYSIQAADASREEQQRTELRLQEENRQIKSVQEQLGKKLTEVENQLKSVEGAAKAKQDVRAFADQVKRQLYEELHVEKLRRGLI